MNRPLPDGDARLIAASAFDRNLVVEAGAGTGKTSLLVERLLTALGTDRVEVTGLAAITFTEKAAGEMRQRLAEGLEELRRIAAGEQEPDLHRAAGRAHRYLAGEAGIEPGTLRQRVLRALGDLDRARVTTIHAFCADLLRTFPLEAGVDPAFQVDQGHRLHEILTQGWQRFALRELGRSAPRPELWRSLLAQVDLGSVEQVARGTGSRRNLAGFDIPRRLLDPPDSVRDPGLLFRAQATELIQEIRQILERQTGMTDATVKIFEALEAGLRSLAEDGLPGLLQEIGRNDLLDTRLGMSGAPSKTKNLEGIDPDHMKQLYRDARTLMADLQQVEDELPARLVTAAAPFVQEVREAILAAGTLDFDALLVLARDLLRDRPDVRERVRQRYSMLLVDEFQDTDPLQYEIVLMLTGSSGESETDPFAVPLEPGRLFIVGDPKQSIYRFRGADYRAYRRVVDRVVAQGGERLDLTANFRSPPELLTPVNRLFERPDGPWRSSRYQPDYVAIQPGLPGDGTGGVEVWTVEHQESASERRAAEGRVLTAGIREMARAGTPYRDILVLLRAFTDLAAYVRPLREAGIPFVVDGGKAFLERPEVVQLMAVLRALARPSDPVALLAYLRSPAAGVPDTELAAYAETGAPWHRRSRPDPLLFPTLAPALARLRDLAVETALFPTGRLIRTVLDRTGLLPMGGFAFEGAQRVANLRKLAEAARELAADGSLSLNQVLDRLETEGASDVEGDSPLADEGTDAVRILTIHKAKGLESPVVFVPDLARVPSHHRTDGVEVRAVQPPGDAPPTLAIRLPEASNAAWVWSRREEKQHQQAEDIRLLYVALTRARHRLILLAGRPTKGKAPWLEALRSWGYDPDNTAADPELLEGTVLHRRLRGAAASRGSPPVVIEEAPEAVERYQAAVTTWRAGSEPTFRRPSGLHEDREARWDRTEEEPSAPATSRDLAMALGTLVHQALERWDRETKEDLLAPVTGMARRLAAEAGLVELEAELAEQGRELLEGFLVSPLAERLRAVEVLGREVALLLQDGDGRRWRGSIDLVYRDEDGAVVVADYKTDRDEDGVEERYAGQLGVYGEAVRKALGLKGMPRAELWLVRSGRQVVVPAEGEISPGG